MNVREHVAVNGCGNVPAGVCVPFDRHEQMRLAEVDWQRFVRRVAVALGWEVAHVGRARTGQRIITPTTPGWPDLWMVRSGRALAVELKRQSGQVRPEQLRWIALLDSIPGVTALVARPSDWPTLQQLLTTDTIGGDIVSRERRLGC